MKTRNTEADVLIESNRSWTVTKEGDQVDLTLDDIQQLIRHLALAGDLVVLDHGGGPGWSGDEIGVSVNGNIIQIRLVKAPGPQPVEAATEADVMRHTVLCILEQKTATRKVLRAELEATTEHKRTVLDAVLADLRTEGIIELSHGRFRLLHPRRTQPESSPRHAPIDDEAFLAELERM